MVNGPMCNMVFVHELYSLINWVIRFAVEETERTYLACLRKKSYKLSKRLERRVIKWTQKRVHHDGRIVWQLNNIEQMYTMVFWIRKEWLRREKPVNVKLKRTLLSDKPFQHHRSPVGDPGCVQTQTQLLS